ncbi:DNA photolyase family protein, partial [Myxococcota bacterium]|nr:DNA photolyase family protein [Myxococcota bacterium]
DRVDAWLPVFVSDPALLKRHPPDRPRTRFLLDCLAALERDLAKRGVALQRLEGNPAKVLPEFALGLGVSLVSWNRAPTPFGQRRDARVEKALGRARIDVLVELDDTIFGPDEIRTQAGGLHSVYTPYRNAWWRAWHAAPRPGAARIRLPARPIPLHWAEDRRRGARARSAGSLVATASDSVPGPLREAESKMRGLIDFPKLPTGGEAVAARRLARFLSGPARRYAIDRDFPQLDGTSRLSPHLRFGTLSVRRCFGEGLARAKADPASSKGISKWLDELVWREFYHAVLARSPHVLTRNHRSEYDTLEWRDDDVAFEAWKAGRTGYPFVDAGMRQLAATGWMHNRLRMVVASFLTKDLLIDWRRGARHFFDALVDGDPASNNGGWQWAASTGTDAQPFFRIFNPVAQGRCWDPEGCYVRRWVPELRRLPTHRIHSPWEGGALPDGYPPPIVDHAAARDRALAAFRRVRQGASRARTRSSR